jgi:hypothetical protein
MDGEVRERPRVAGEVDQEVSGGFRARLALAEQPSGSPEPSDEPVSSSLHLMEKDARGTLSTRWWLFMGA